MKFPAAGSDIPAGSVEKAAAIARRAISEDGPYMGQRPAALVIAIWSIDRKSAGLYRVNKGAYAT